MGRKTPTQDDLDAFRRIATAVYALQGERGLAKVAALMPEATRPQGAMILAQIRASVDPGLPPPCPHCGR